MTAHTTMTAHKRTLDQRIAEALTLAASTHAADLATLIAEVEAAIITADEAASAAAKRALDPRVIEPAARTTQSDAEFRSSRLLAALPPLRARHQQAGTDEAYARWVVAYDEVKAQRDAVVAELRTLYPAVVAQLVALLTRAQAVDAAITRLTYNHPDRSRQGSDGRSLRDVELEARDISHTGIYCLSIISDLKLPAWEPSSVHAWPLPAPRVPLVPLLNLGSVTGPPEFIAARNAEREKEAERIAACYAAQERGREALNKEADREALARKEKLYREAGWAP